MEYIFHETQEGSLCAQHCLNSLLQGDYYSAVDLANIAHELDNIERNFMSEAGTSSADYHNFLSQESSNYDDTGFFSIQVLQKALKQWNLELIPFTSSNDIAKAARHDPINQKAYICNFKHHWYTIRKIANYWFNLNSMLKEPELISDTYLAVLLAQLQQEGYSIFIVDGDLPQCQADVKLLENPVDVKQVLASYNFKKKSLKTPRAGNNEDFDDEELKKAIKISLMENDLDSDSRHGLFPSLAYESSSNKHDEPDEEDEFKKAIELSLQNNNNNPTTSNAQTSSAEMSAEDIRKKRLEFLDKSKQN